MNVLIVDDHRMIVDDLIDEIGELIPHAECFGASGGEEALALSQTVSFDVALLDIDMPGMDGLTLAKKLAALRPLINIIFVTGYREYALESYEVYASGFLLKPVSTKKLKSAFENLRHPIPELSRRAEVDHYAGGAVIGKKIEHYRMMRGMSREQLAQIMGVSRQTVYRWESGQRLPDVVVFVKLAQVLEVELSEFGRFD